MAINQNRNSIRVLRTTAAGHLLHKNIPDLAIGTGSDFTIQLWVVKGKDTDGVLYSQEGGFSIQLVDGQAVFSLDGFATLSAGTDWKVSAHRQDYIAVRYQSGKLALFLGGLKIAEKSVSAKVAPGAGDFAIGKQFTGGFSLIRVSKTARSDQELLSDNAAPPGVDSHCVFQSDCSGVQYRDASANHLSMWAEGEGAGCGIYTACTVFDGAGQVRCTPAESLNATHTLLLKLWPQDRQRTQCLYTAMDGTKTLYAVELEAQSDHTFRLSLTSGSGGKATMSKPLLPELWQDVAAVFDGGKVKLYLDGKQDGEYAFSFSGTRSEVLVGAEYETGRPIYEKGFSGYIAYTAEFGRALPAKEIALYADDPPFMFEDGLVSLLPLDWPGEVEAVGATPLSVTGSAPFNMVPDSTPRGGDIGCSMRIPTEVSPEWKKLSAQEQWTLELLGKLILETFTGLCGYPSAAGADAIPLWQRITRFFLRHNRALYERLPLLPPNDPDLANTATQLARALGGRGNTPFGQWLAGLFGGGGATTTAGNGANFTASNAGFIMGTSLGLAMTAAVGLQILESQDERPSQDGALTVDSVCWDHKGDPTQGGIHYHKGGADLPATMADVPGATQLETLCVLVPSKLKKPTLDVTLSLSDQAQTARTGTLNAYDLTSGGLLGHQSVSYTVAPATCVTVQLPFRADKLPKDTVQKLTHTWQFWDGDTFLLNCVCTIYLLPGLPITPWVVNSGTAYQPNEGRYVRLELLDFFMEKGQEKKDVPKLCTQALNRCGYFQYARADGNVRYVSLKPPTQPRGELLLKLEKLVSHLQAGDHLLNCVDCACIVNAGCAMAGVSLPMGRFSGDVLQSTGFQCNLLIAIGYTKWDTPLEGGDPFLAFHQVNIKGTAPTQTVPVYDACLQVDGGSYPGGDDLSKKKALLPLGLKAQETDKVFVNVPESKPYKGQFYRERLVSDEEICLLEDAEMDLVDFSSAMTLPRRDAAPAPMRPAVRAIWERFALGTLPETAVAAPLEDWDAAPLAGAKRNESGPGYGDWTVEAEGQGPVWVERRFCATAEAAARYMAGALFNVAHPDVRDGEAEGVSLGERCFLLGTGGVLFCRRGNVFTVGAETTDAALGVARALDESVRAG